MTNTVTFTHAQFNSEVVLFADQVFGIVEQPIMKCRAVIGTGGAAVPIKETKEEALQKIAAAKAATTPTEEKI